ncbi:MAG: RnfABCDGE type electron transport complex subunit D [Patescibacteria group bacterium]|nr:RnfABCDGE type electron transport complex subunit D [Patescibacteria group bacterium]
MLQFVDNLLNRVTMYRLVLYYLVALVFAAFVFGFFGLLPYDPTAIAFSTLLIVAVCWATNWIFAKVFEAATNIESVYITALILVLIISPVVATDRTGVGFLIFASVWAMASKYLLAIGKKHIFNPAALAVALTALVLGEPATWWVGGNLALLPIVLVGGLLVVRKIRRFDLVGSFAAVSLITIVATSGSADYLTPVVQTILHSSFFFLAFVMLTEPLTTPPNRLLRVLYGAMVGFLFAPNIHIGGFYLTPELALLAGNVFSYLVSPKGRYMLTLTGIEQAAADAYDFVFTPDRTFKFRPGQYLEWTLGHHYPDDRGNRRYFTIASAPTESNVRLGVKFYNPSSTFKRALASMKPGDKISAAHLAGGFVLPKDKNKKLVFIAGGIGVTPFRSMVRYLLDIKEARPVTMLYANKTAADIAYKDIFDRAQDELGIKTVYATGSLIDAKLIAQEVPDYRERTFYISGPHSMVDAFKHTLTGMGVSRFKIKTDFFPGFA